MKEIIYNIIQATTSRVITFGVDEMFSKDNILGIINKTQSKVLYTPVNAANIVYVTCNEGTLTISLADDVPVILAGDELFVKLYSENEEKIDTTELAKEQTLIDKAEEIKQAVENAKPEIDTTELAKQGDDPDATNTAIYNAVNTLLSRSVKYDKNTGNLTIENVELEINEQYG